jgi:hypothetical protein
MNKEMKIRVPIRIKPGDTIGIVAPAGPFDRQTLFRGARVIEDMGFRSCLRISPLMLSFAPGAGMAQ